MNTAGLNRCEAGWLLITFNEDKEPCQLIRDVADLEAAIDSFDRVFINLPIGLSEENTGRACDTLLKETLGPDYQDQIILPPVRPVLEAPTYAEANIWTYEYTGAKLDSRTWSLVPRIRIIDRLLEEKEERRDVLFESHPELLFMRLNGGRIYQNQSTRAGQKHRLGLIKGKEPSSAELYRTIKETYRRNEVDEESIVNTMALAAAVKLSAGSPMKSLPEDAPAERIPADSKGLKMAFYYI